MAAGLYISHDNLGNTLSQKDN